MLCKYLYDNGIIKKSSIPIITYGIKALKEFLFSLLVTAFWGFVCGITIESLLFFIILSSLRFYTGGYHAQTKKKCSIISHLAIIIGIVSIKIIFISNLIKIFVLIINSFILICFAPIEAVNKPLALNEKKHYAKISRFLCSFYCAVGVLLYREVNYFNAVLVAFCLVALGVICSIYKKNSSCDNKESYQREYKRKL